MDKRIILQWINPSIVTYLGDWKQMLKDIERLRLTKISLFLTVAKYPMRKKIYERLLKSSIREIPHVHIRHDMKEGELDFFVDHFHTKAFSLHCPTLPSFLKSKYVKMMYVENNNEGSAIDDPLLIEKAGGMCIDLSHHKEFSVHERDIYKLTQKLVQKHKVGCNHLSAVMKNGKSHHRVEKISELDYVTSIPKCYFSRNINLELANPIPEQIFFRKYIAKKLEKAWKI